MAAQRYVIIKLLVQLKEGDEFSPENYPLHITIVPSFQLERMDDVLLDKIKQFCDNLKAFTLAAGQDDFFGPNREVQVTTMVMNDEIRRLHNGLVGILTGAGAVFDEPEYMFENYQAHATVQRAIRLHNNDSVAVEDITIIDKLPNGNSGKRKLLKRLYFSKR